jgi:divalent metal cation (Fe/Co/Zn/Cd) transporter
VLLGAVAVLLVTETRGLLIGEGAHDHVLRRIRDAVRRDPAVLAIHHAVTLQLGPEEVLLNLGIHFRPEETIGELTKAIERLEQRVRATDRRVTRIFVEVEPSPRGASIGALNQSDDTRSAQR